MTVTPMQLRYNELRDFFQSWVPSYGQCDFFFYGQAAPRQNIPYVTANIMSSVEMVGTVERRFDVDGNEKLRTQLNVVCDLYGFSNSSARYSTAVEENNAWAIMQELRTSLRYQLVYDSLTAINCRLLAEDSIVDTTQLLSTTFEPQATCSLTFSTVVESATDNGEIAEVNALGTIYTPDGDPITLDIKATKP